MAPVLHSWAQAFWNAIHTAQNHAAEPLMAIAVAKAKKIETAMQMLSTAKWTRGSKGWKAGSPPR